MVEFVNEEKDTTEEREHIAGARKIQWVYADGAIEAEIRTPGKNLHGFCESECSNLKDYDVIRFERLGFSRLDKNK